MNKIGVRAHDFGRHTPGKLAATVAGAGFEAVQLALTKAIDGVTSVSDVTIGLLDRVRRDFDSAGVEIAVLGCYVECGDLDKEERLRQVANFKLGLAHAKELGVRIVGTETTHYDLSPAAAAGREAAYQGLLDSMLRMAEEAEKQGVCIGVEPVAEHTLNTAALTQRLLEDVGSDQLKVILDPVNLLLPDTFSRQEEIFADCIQRVGERIVALHVKDVVIEDGEKAWRQIGQGKVAYESIFRWIREKKSDIPLLREGVKPETCQMDLEAIRQLAGAR